MIGTAMADMATSNISNSVAGKASSELVQGAFERSALPVVVSVFNQNLIWFLYGFATALAIFSLYFFYLVRKKSESEDKKRTLILASVMFAISILLWIVPPRFIKAPTFPGNFDMRAT